MLEVREICVDLDDTTILREVSLDVKRGEIVGLLGPNGSGKTTTLKCLNRLIEPIDGEILLEGDSLDQFTRKELARRIAMVEQAQSVSFEFSVEDMVSMGRAPHKDLLDWDTREDSRIIEESLEKVSMNSMKERTYQTLSGGEKQRVMIARCLAQKAELFLLDEPTNHLDVRYQMEILDLLKSLKITVLLTMHDLNLASQYCDRLYFLKDGRPAGQGSPKTVLKAERIKDVFERTASVQRNPVTGDPHVYFYPSGVRL